MARRFLLAAASAAALLAHSAEASAQTRTVVVPEGADMVIPPRGSALPPRSTASRPLAQRPRLPPMAPAKEEGGFGFGGGVGAAAVVLPAIAAAALAAALSNGSGGGAGNTASGPVRTR